MLTISARRYVIARRILSGENDTSRPGSSRPPTESPLQTTYPAAPTPRRSARSRPRMMFFDHRLEPRAFDVGINLGGRGVRVAQHRLHRAQIGAAFQKIGRERVAQLV